VMARFLRLKMWDVVYRLREVLWTLIHWALPALAVVTRVGSSPTRDRSNADGMEAFVVRANEAYCDGGEIVDCAVS
jgi:hypothetical protein